VTGRLRARQAHKLFANGSV